MLHNVKVTRDVSKRLCEQTIQEPRHTKPPTSNGLQYESFKIKSDKNEKIKIFGSNRSPRCYNIVQTTCFMTWPWKCVAAYVQHVLRHGNGNGF